MGDEFYAILKLTSGEEILSLISIDENNDDPVILLQDPITMKILHSPRGMHIKVKSWIEMSSDNIFVMKPDKIMTMTETKDEKLIEIYNNYLKDEDDIDIYTPSPSNEKSSSKITPSRKMGYLSTVEEARKTLENIFKLEDTREI